MELTHGLLHALRSPLYLFRHQQLKEEYAKRPSVGKAESRSPGAPDLSNHVSVSGASRRGVWRVDGVTTCGTRFFCVPILPAMGLVPMRVDVYIPDQAEHPPSLRHKLGSHILAVIGDVQSASRSGIADYICQVLSHYTTSDPGWVAAYVRLPFASSIMFENISMDVTNVRVSLEPSYHLERQALTVRRLQTTWRLELKEICWPPTIDLESLRLVKQIHESISIVKVVSEVGSWPDLLVFKSTTNDLAHLYHEMRLLLTMTPHEHIMPQPLGIVTKTARFGSKQGVVGFLVPYYPHGSIRDLVPQAMKMGTLQPTHQVQIVQQVLAALIHVVEEQQTFYSDLRLDNVLIHSIRDNNDGEKDPFASSFSILLCDFEQRGNWHEWSASEVLYPQYCQTLSRHRPVDDHDPLWGDLIAAYESSWFSNSPPVIDPAVLSANTSWFRLTKLAAEKAMTYSFGLFMYCIFEGLPNPCLNIANAFSHESQVEFPEFRHTPPSVRQLVRDCTIDATDRSFGCVPAGRSGAGLFRSGHKIYPNDHEVLRSQDAVQIDIEDSVLDSAHQFWLAELEKARNFVESSENVQNEYGSRRPTLREVQQMLDHIQRELLTEG